MHANNQEALAEHQPGWFGGAARLQDFSQRPGAQEPGYGGAPGGSGPWRNGSYLERLTPSARRRLRQSQESRRASVAAFLARVTHAGELLSRHQAGALRGRAAVFDAIGRAHGFESWAELEEGAARALDGAAEDPRVGAASFPLTYRDGVALGARIANILDLPPHLVQPTVAAGTLRHYAQYTSRERTGSEPTAHELELATWPLARVSTSSAPVLPLLLHDAENGYTYLVSHARGPRRFVALAQPLEHERGLEFRSVHGGGAYAQAELHGELLTVVFDNGDSHVIPVDTSAPCLADLSGLADEPEARPSRERG